MGGAGSTESKSGVQAQPSSRNQVVPVSEAAQTNQPSEDAARLRQQLQQEKEDHKLSLEAAAAENRKRLDEAAAVERRRLDADAATERKRLDDDAAAQRARLDEEDAAERKRLADVATTEASSDRRRLDEEAADVRKRLDDDATVVRQHLDEQAEVQRKRLDADATAVRQHLDDQATVQRKRLDDDAAAGRKRLDEEAAALRGKLDDEAATERRRLNDVVAALQQQLQSLMAGLATAGPVVAAAGATGLPRSYAAEAVDVQPINVRPAFVNAPVQAAAVPGGDGAAAAAAERERQERDAAAAASIAAANAAAAAAAAEQRRLQEELESAERRKQDAIEAAAAAERRKVEEEVERTWGEQDLVAGIPSQAMQLEQLPSSIMDLHDGMPAPLRQAPMRLLWIDSVLAWPNIRVYEEVDTEHECIEVPYEAVDGAMWDSTMILSWRWSAQKPTEYITGFAPMSDLQFDELGAVLRRARGEGMRYVWIDWCCVPQYGAPSMVEVLRSKVFYARARAMTVVPTFVTIPTDGIVRLLLLKATRAIRTRAAGNSPRSRIALGVLESILTKERVAGREYFTRVWTLAERMARFGRPDQLCNWLSLEAWLGTLVDAMLKSADDRSASEMYKRILGREAGRRLDAVLDPLEAAVKTGSMHVSEGLDEKVAELFELAVGIWHTHKELAEAPTKEWLVSYLLDAHTGIYAAWSDADRVWAVYSYFCWKQLDQRSEAGLLEALQDLVRVAGGGRRLLMCMATKLGLAKALPPTELDKKLVVAAEANNTEELMAALEGGAFPDYPGTDGGTALYFSAAKGNVAAVKMLIKCGATVDFVNVNGASALHAASSNGHAEAAAALLEAGANKELTKLAKRTPLHVAAARANESMVRLLVTKGANLEATDAEGMTPLYLAASNNDTADVTRVLLEAGAKKTCMTSTLLSVLHGAATKGCEDTVRLLLHAGMDPNVVIPDKQRNFVPLHFAAEKGHTGVIRALIQGGAKVDVTSVLGTPLHRACAFDNVDAVRALVSAGANKEAREPGDSKTPLMVAAHSGKVEAVKVMIELAASITAADKDGWLPIHFAAKADSYECCRVLKTAGASTKVKTKAGNFPCDLAKTSRVQGLLPDGKGLIESGGNALLKAFF